MKQFGLRLHTFPDHIRDAARGSEIVSRKSFSRLYHPDHRGTGLRDKIHHEDPNCYWCGKLTEIPFRAIKRPGHDQATIDHLFAKCHPWRYRLPAYVVLACNSCNKKRNNEELNDGVALLELV